MYLSMCVQRCDDRALVSVDGDVDINSAPWFQQRLMYLLEGNGPRLLADLSGVTFIDCFATRLLAGTCRRAGGRPCPIQFVALPKPVARLAELTGLAGELPVAGPFCGGPAVPRSVSAMTESGTQQIPGPTTPGSAWTATSGRSTRSRRTWATACTPASLTPVKPTPSQTS
jgi:anti-sigma B factor antagonist